MSSAIAMTVTLILCLCRKSTSHLQRQYGQNTDLLQFDGVAKIDELQPGLSACVGLLIFSAPIWHTVFCSVASFTQYRKSLILKLAETRGTVRKL